MPVLLASEEGWPSRPRAAAAVGTTARRLLWRPLLAFPDEKVQRPFRQCEGLSVALMQGVLRKMVLNRPFIRRPRSMAGLGVGTTKAVVERRMAGYRERGGGRWLSSEGVIDDGDETATDELPRM